MRFVFTWVVFFCVAILSASALAADVTTPAPKASSTTTDKATATKPAPAKAAPKATSKNPGKSMQEDAWYKDGAPHSGRGTLWEKGQPAESLTHDRTEMGKARRQAQRDEQARRERLGTSARPLPLDTQKGINSALNELSTYERQPADGSEAGLNKPGAPTFQVTQENSSWRNEASGIGTVGQDVMVTRRNVVGAYADVVKNDDLRVSVGPELHIPDTETTSNHIAPQHPESSTLGVGMKWQWDF